MKDKKGLCRLCLKNDFLCESHIIPEFFYKNMDLYDDKHRYSVISNNHDIRPRFKQKGVRERLLCKTCETKLSKLERYCSMVFFGGEPLEIMKCQRGLELKVDYTKYKLFQLSILWKIGISTLEEFSTLEIGDHEDVIRKMILDEKPGNTSSYGCIMIRSTKYDNLTSGLIHCIGNVKIGKVECVRLLLGGFFWLYFLSDSAIDDNQKELFLQSSGHLRILITDKDPNHYIERLMLDFCANPRNR